MALLQIKLLRLPMPPHDFMPYWAAGHLFLSGSNPYSIPALLAVERSQGLASPQPLVMLCPPWTLPIIAMMAAVPLHAARIAWLLISVLLNVFCAAGLWIYFGGGKRRLWIALLVAFTFLPIGTADRMGQITPLILLSITGFLLLLRSQRDFWAGAVLLGFGFKPHLLYLVWIAIFLWILQNHRWKIIAGAAASYLTPLVIDILHDNQALHYFHNTYGTAIDTACGLGGALRTIFGMQHIWLQYLPSVIGMVWFISYWRRNGGVWNWQNHLPILLVVSLASSPYYWLHDFILILPAMISLAARQAWRSSWVLACYFALQFTIGLMKSNIFAAALSTLWILFYLLADSETFALQTGTSTTIGYTTAESPTPTGE
ncbi:MAG: DUF2029 domain-containing protein [Silvibacterium sp.]|nr:DUF2029 domain-containing protein [Silvibacterium sp.]